MEFDLDRKCCDPRSSDCGSLNIFVYPISYKNKIFVKAQIIEVIRKNGLNQYFCILKVIFKRIMLTVRTKF